MRISDWSSDVCSSDLALFSLLIFAVPEPVRRGMGTVQRISGHFWRDALGYYAALLRFMQGRGSFFLYHYTGFGFAAMIVTGAGTWYPAFMGRTYGRQADQLSIYLGLAWRSVVVGKTDSVRVVLGGRRIT